MTEPAIALAGVSVEFPSPQGVVHALRGATFTCARGESVAVVGRSGSGKSTLMSILALLRRPTAGRVYIDGTEASGLPEREVARVRAEHVGVVFQSFHLEPSLTARENTLLPWRLAGSMSRVPASAARARADELLDELGIGDLARRKVTAMSGGQRQRVAIARALMVQPTVIVADEPTGNLDEETADDVARMLYALPRTHNSAVIVVTHDPAVAARADRTVHLAHGSVMETIA